MDFWLEHLFIKYKNTQKSQTIFDALGEICKGEDYSVAYLLESEEFKCLSEDNKAVMFSLIHEIRSTNQDKETCPHKKDKYDNPTYLQQILPYMPLHKFESYNLRTADLTGIESEEWMRDMLMTNKVRWNPEANVDVIEKVTQEARDSVADAKLQNDEDDMNSSGTDETIHKLRNLAFTMLAAELFHVYCSRKALRCCEFLLSVAPNLVDIHAGKEKVVAFTTALMYDSSQMINILQAQRAPISDIGQAAHAVFYKSKSLHSFYIIRSILQDKNVRDEVRLYQDQDGKTILHLLIEPLVERTLWQTNKRKATKHVTQCIQCIQSCIKTMLDHGADPHKMNNKNETVLDVLIYLYIEHAGFRSSKLTKMFLRNLQLILPFWGLALPLGFPRRHKTVQGRVVMLCKLAELLLNDEHSFKFAIRCLQNKTLFRKCTPTDCQLCLPAVSLFYNAMSKGIDMYSIPGNRLPFFLSPYKDYVSYSLWAISSSYDNLHRCCYFALLELLVHSGNDAFSHMEMKEYDGEFNPGKLLCKLLNNRILYWCRSRLEFFHDQIFRIMSMLSMYSPSIYQSVLERLLREHTSHAHADKEVVLMLETIAQTHGKFGQLRPLKLLCRLTIRGNVAWKDVEKLPLPQELKHYVRIGLIPKDHVIHQIIDKLEAIK